MEPLYHNKTCMDARACREFLALTWGKNVGVFRVILVVVAVFAVAYGILQLVLGQGGLLVYALLLFLMADVAIFLAFFGYLMRVGRYLREQQKLWGGDTLDKEVWFYEEYFLQKTRLGELRFLYPQLTKVSCNRRGVVLFFGSQALYMDRQGFGEEGQGASFRTFIRGKIIAIKS